MSFEECLDDAKARLIMVAFVKFSDENYKDIMSTLQEISKEYKKLIILAVDATRNLVSFTGLYLFVFLPLFQ